MHVASVAVFAVPAPSYAEVTEEIEERLRLVPRYRQRLAVVPLRQGRPMWVDDPHFRVGYHVRHTALPRPGSDEQLRLLAGRVLSQALDRTHPLWELWLVEGLASGRFAALAAGAARGLGALTSTGLAAAPPSPFNVPIGPHRRTRGRSRRAPLHAVR